MTRIKCRSTTNEGKKDISKFTIEWELRQLNENGEYVEAYEFEWLGEGHRVKPSMIVWAENEGVLVKDYDYSCKFINNDRPGVATVIVKGKNDYCGELRKDFKIVDKESNNHYEEESSISLKTDMLLVGSFLMYKKNDGFVDPDFGFWALYYWFQPKKSWAYASNGKKYTMYQFNKRFERTLSNLKKGLLDNVPKKANVSFKSSDSRIFKVWKSKKGIWKGKLEQYGVCDLDVYDGSNKIDTVKVFHCPKELKDGSDDGYKLKVKRKGNKLYFKPYLSKWITNPKHKITWKEVLSNKKIKDGESFVLKRKKGQMRLPTFRGYIDTKIEYLKNYCIFLGGEMRHTNQYELEFFSPKKIKKIPTKWVTMTLKLYRKIK